MIVADTGAIIALINADDRHHDVLREAFEGSSHLWVLPWAILPEVDYLLANRIGTRAQLAFMADLAGGAFDIEWGDPRDLARARELHVRYAHLCLGLADGVVMAIAERLRASAIATLDVRHFGAVDLDIALWPRDL